MQNKLTFFALLLMVNLLPGTFVFAQTANESLYEQTSEMGTLIIGYQRDVDAINDFYYPYSSGGTYAYPMATFKSPEQRKRLQDINNDYLSKLKSAKFEGFSIYGKVDYILLKKQIESSVWLLGKEETDYNALSKYFTFADPIYALEKLRRRGTYKEGSLMAAQMDDIAKQIDVLNLNFKQGILKPDQLKMATAITLSLKHRLKGFYQFYMDYEPGFTWWAPKPYEKLDLALTQYAKLFNDKEAPTPASKSNKPEIKGNPIGREELIRQLNAELIPYTPEELIKLAEKEFKFCDEELLKASEIGRAHV